MNFPTLTKIPQPRKQAFKLRVSLILLIHSFAFDVFAEASIADYIAQAKSALTIGNSQQAAELYEKAAALGEAPEAEIGLVRAYLQAGEFRKAIAFANLVAAEHPDISETAALLAYLEDLEGQTPAAIAKITAELNQQPDDVALTAAYAEILLNHMATPQAIQLLDTWMARNPANADINRLRARAALITGDQKAVQSWREQTLILEEKTKQSTDVKPTTHWPSHPLAAFSIDQHMAFKSGNGLVVDEGRKILTTAPLVTGATDSLLVRNGLGKIAKAHLEKIFADQGLALLRLETPYPKNWSITLQNPVLNNVRFCFVFCFPLTDSLETLYPIIIPSVVVRADVGVGQLMQISSSLAEDKGGSPVFDNTGRLIALTIAKQNLQHPQADQELLGNGAFAVRIDALQTLTPVIAKKKAKKLKAPVTSTSVEELYEKLLPTLVTIIVPN